MEKLTSVLAALDAGKLPSQDQTNQFIDWLITYGITQIEPGASDNLSKQGRLLADDVRGVLEAYKQLGSNKNADNILQKAIWHLTEGDLSKTTTTGYINSKESSSDIKAIRSSLKVLVKSVWASISSEGSSFFNDFASFSRLALSDAAELIEEQASRTKEGLRNIEDDVQDGKRDNLGRDKQRLEEEEGDMKVQFEHGMDTLKGAGSSMIGAGQSAKATVEETADKASSRIQDAYIKICDRAQNDPEYHDALLVIFDIVEKWLTKTIDTATSINSSTTIDSFIDDPTPEQHVPKALHCLVTLVERLAGNKPLDDLFSSFRKCAADVRQDKDLKSWFDGFFKHIRKSLDEAGYARSDEAKKTKKELRARWKALQDADSDAGRKSKKDFDALKDELKVFEERIAADKDLNKVKEAHEKLGSDIANGLVEVGKKADEMGISMQAAIEKASWFWQDLFKVYMPRALSMMKDIPIPRTEYKDSDVEFVLENLDVSSFNILPSHIYIRNITDVDINTTKTTSHTAVGSLTHIRVQAMQLALRDVSFWYKDKTASIGPSEFSGLLAFNLPEKGVDVDLKIRMIPATAPGKGDGERERRGAFNVIEKVVVSIAEDVDLEVKECNHAILLSLFKPIFVMRFREALEKTLTEQIKSGMESLDGIAWDVGRRSEVFEDTGMGKGSAFAAAVWSEIGRLRKMDSGSGLLSGWKATGSGLVKESVDSAEGKPAFAMGAEPQILGGEKRGPLGTASEPIAERIQRVLPDIGGVDGEDVGDAVDGVKRQVKDVTQQMEGLMQDGKDQIKSFKQSVDVKSKEEQRSVGWESSAFDL